MPGEESALPFGPHGRGPDRRGFEHEGRDLSDWLGQSVFVTRHIGIVVLAVAAAVVPALGDHRGDLIVVLLGVVLPYNIALHLEMGWRGRIPAIMPITDQLLACLFPLIEPGAWVPTLVIVTADTALAVSAFGMRRAVAGLGLGCALLTFVGLQHFDGGTVAVGVLAYAIGGAILAVTVGVVSSGERQLHRRYSELVAGLDAIVWEADPATLTFTYVSEAAARLTGHSLDEWRAPGFWVDHIHEDDRAEAVSFCRAATARGRDHDLEYRMVTADGLTVWLQDVVRVQMVDGEITSLSGVMVDISDRKRDEKNIRQYGNIVDRMPLGLLTAQLGSDDELRLVNANPAASELLGVEPQLLLGESLASALPRIATPSLLPRLRAVADGGDAFDVDGLAEATPDPDRVIALRAFPLTERSVGIALDDTTGATLAAAAMRRRAMHDDLTGLPNRILLRDRVRQALQQSQRTDEPVALMILDLDQFKEVNDALGHQYGDLLLIEVGQRLERIVRECDTIARLGGDEFALLLTTNATPAGALRVAEKITDALAKPFEIEGIALQTNASIGIALYPLHGDTAESLTQRADVAMYTAKRSGSRFALYAADVDHSSVARLTLLGEIRGAVEQGEFMVLYQPVLDLATGRIDGAEALVRWDHPEHGVLEPSLFIELAEVSGAIQPLTRAVISQAVRDIAIWRERDIALRVSVNLSVRNLYDPDLLPWTRATLHRHGVEPASLAVELTESQIMDDTSVALDVLGALRDLGIETAIDDFGTGYSSLAYLRDLPIAEVKIDRSFVSEISQEQGSTTIVRSIVDLAHNLDLAVLAEGVEDEGAIEVLRDLGCDRVQGFAIGRPMPADALAALVLNHRGAALPAR